MMWRMVILWQWSKSGLVQVVGTQLIARPLLCSRMAAFMRFSRSEGMLIDAKLKGEMAILCWCPKSGLSQVEGVELIVQQLLDNQRRAC